MLLSGLLLCSLFFTVMPQKDIREENIKSLIEGKVIKYESPSTMYNNENVTYIVYPYGSASITSFHDKIGTKALSLGKYKLHNVSDPHISHLEYEYGTNRLCDNKKQVLFRLYLNCSEGLFKINKLNENSENCEIDMEINVGSKCIYYYSPYHDEL